MPSIKTTVCIDDFWPQDESRNVPGAFGDWVARKKPVILSEDDDGRPCVKSWPEAKELWPLPETDEGAAFSALKETLEPLGYSQFVVSNQMRCEICGEFIESTHRHDYRKCACGNIGVDGGHDYARQTRRTERFTDCTVFGWAAEGDVRTIIDALVAEGPRTSFQDRMIAGRPMRTYEIAGRERGGGEVVLAYSEGRTKYEAARPVVAAHPGMSVERITDRSLPFDRQILIEKLGLDEESRENIVVDALDEWECATDNLYETAGSADEVRILNVHIARKGGDMASERIEDLSR